MPESPPWQNAIVKREWTSVQTLLAFLKVPLSVGLDSALVTKQCASGAVHAQISSTEYSAWHIVGAQHLFRTGRWAHSRSPHMPSRTKGAVIHHKHLESIPPHPIPHAALRASHRLRSHSWCGSHLSTILKTQPPTYRALAFRGCIITICLPPQPHPQKRKGE